jgi:hypothetical protein
VSCPQVIALRIRLLAAAIARPMSAGSANAASSTVGGMEVVHHTYRPTGQPTEICLPGATT